ncbi:MAG: adenylate/guanylate cyclase domain-containing protein [Actinobacteria bacterium]|nr:adenylate/guanylate cyclase domain-containing protein [Actinomycetota bacterium]
MTRLQLARQTDWRMTRAMLTSNIAGAFVVYVFLIRVLPIGLGTASGQRRANTIAFAGYLVLSVAVGQLWGGRVFARLRAWLRSDAPPDDGIRSDLLRLPLRQTGVNATLWLGAAVVFGALNASYADRYAVDICSTIVLGGFATCGIAYLLSELCLRPVVTLAMQGAVEPPPVLLGVKPRLVLAWALGTGIPLLGIVLGVTTPTDAHPPLTPGGVLFLSVIGLVVGLLAMLAAAGGVSDPVRSVAAALRDVGQGRLDIEVPVYDASEVGQLQSGFNTMMTGLRERDRLRDLFGRQVGDAVARRALEHGVELGGEVREVAVLFVDVVGSTGMALTNDPQEVVRRLNAFFGVVVGVVTAHGGWVNKFEGDAALCIFGAPVDLPEATSACLRAARELALRLRELPVDAAVGVSAGAVVAGNVGAETRFEYTVIGDPVNAAARLTELAKTTVGCVLADAAVVATASAEEAAHWQSGEQVVLRGRDRATTLARPL